MPGKSRSDPKYTWLLDLAVALGVALLPAIYLVKFLAEDACLDAGGAVRRAGMDALCEFADGTLVPLHSPTTGERLVVVGSWVALALVLFLAGRRFIRRGGASA